MSVKESIPIERPCGDCSEVFTPAVLTWPDPKRDKCQDCESAFIKSMFIKPKIIKEGEYNARYQ